MLQEEMAVLSAVMVDPDCVRVLAPELDIGDFETLSQQLLWACFLDLFEKRERIDAISVLDWVRRHKKGDVVSKEYVIEVRDYLSEVGEDSTKNVLAWCQLVKERSGRRKLMAVCEAVKDELKEGVNPVDEIHAQALEKLMNCRKVEQRGYKAIGDFAESLREVTAQWFSGVKTAIPTGFPTLDKMIGGGLYGKRLYVIGGRPGTGKTSFAWSLMRNIAEWLVESKKPGVVAFASLEMSAEDVYMRGACSGAGVDCEALMGGDLKGNVELNRRFDDELERIRKLPIWIDDTDTLTSALVHYRTALVHALEGVVLLVVDFVELVVGENSEGEELRISGIFKAGKTMAKALGIPVILLSQLNREVDKTENKLPQLRHIRYGGSGEATGDSVWFVYDPYLYVEMGDNVIPPEGMRVAKDVWYLIIEKQRYGKLGYVPFRIEREFLRIRDINVTIKGKEDF